ncbi:putative 21p1 protein [Bracoviriform inaniti]|uniref:Putative 21p1 protein n=1 Tax=Bracoviriform inaniti TaxID=36344 RepID=Q702I6_9VIRU|nr:putative 21p1 protein [Bracoviriform inaniti]CAF25486.1 putative 21p1 protein [Bracoviriform inaniti]
MGRAFRKKIIMMTASTADCMETIHEEGGKIYTNLVPRQPPKKRLYRKVIDHIHAKYDTVLDKLNLILRKLDKWDHEKALEKKGLVEKPSYLPLKNMEEFITHSYLSEFEFSQLLRLRDGKSEAS